MKAKTKKRLTYSLLFIIIFTVELLIALFVRDDFIRPYVGDILVIILLGCMARIVFPERPKLLGLYMIAAGVIAELLQLAELDKLLGIEGTVLGVILGSTFDLKDIVCYIIGGLLFSGIERAVILWQKSKLISGCGFYCGSCPTYQNGGCKGCRKAHGEGDCATLDCIKKQSIDHCGNCKDFPCKTIITESKCTVLDKEWLAWQASNKKS